MDQRPPRGQLRMTPETGPKPRALGGGRGVEEPSVIGIRTPRRAGRPAVDPGGDDADEEEAVEARIARVERPLAEVGGERQGKADRLEHAANLHLM